MQHTPLTAHEGSMQGTILEDKKLPVIKNGPTGVVYTSDIASFGGEDTPGKLRNATLLHKRLHDDQQGSTNSGPYTTDNQVTFLFQLPLAFLLILVAEHNDFTRVPISSLRWLEVWNMKVVDKQLNIDQNIGQIGRHNQMFLFCIHLHKVVRPIHYPYPKIATSLLLLLQQM